jgi:hypothetical protein
VPGPGPEGVGRKTRPQVPKFDPRSPKPRRPDEPGRKTRPEVPKIDPPSFDGPVDRLPPLDVRILRVAKGREGIITLAALEEAGLSRRSAAKRVSTGRLFRIHQGVYSIIPPSLLTPQGRKLAAVLACGEGAALSHLAAAVHTRFTGGAATPPRILDVTVPRRGGQRREGIRIHRSKTLRPQDVTEVYCVPCTTVARTILDVSDTLTGNRLEEVIDDAIRQDLVSCDQLLEQIAHNHGRPEATILASVLDHWDALAALTENQLEKRLFAALQQAGLPLPQPQVWLDLHDGGQRLRADFLYVQEMLILETDGWRTHGHRREQDSLRDQRAAAAGLRTLRITRRQVVDELD